MIGTEGLIRSGTATSRRYLIVVRAGDESLHRNWLSGAEHRDFDLLVSYYGTHGHRYQTDADLYHAMAGTRWVGHHTILRDNPSLLEPYDFICFACDDLDADAATWNALFNFCETHILDLAQPAILGPVSFQITKPVKHALYRTTTYVECMCPVFSRRALGVCRPTFGESISGWGLGGVWSKLLRERDWNLAIIDAVCVTHTRPVGEGSLYKLLSDLGVDPSAEKNSVLARYGIAHQDVRELSRVHRSILHKVADVPALIARLRRFRRSVEKRVVQFTRSTVSNTRRRYFS